MNFADEFNIEAKELLDDIEEGLLELESDCESEDAYNRVYRALHSLKGASGMMGFDEVQEHIHRTEDKFQELKENRKKLKECIDYFLSSVDHSRLLLSGETEKFNYLEDDIKGDSSDDEKIKEAMLLLDKAYHLLMYQYVDLDIYLKEKNKDLVRDTIKKEITEIGITLERLKSK
jgi:chemotaxis protein histidine kinase CheA